MDTISRRDYFIGQALAGIIAKYGMSDSVYVGNDSYNYEDAREVRISDAVELADALIARLDGEKESSKTNR